MSNFTPSLDKFDCEGEAGSVDIRWVKWKHALNIYLEAAGIEIATKKRANLLHLGGLRDLPQHTGGSCRTQRGR